MTFKVKKYVLQNVSISKISENKKKNLVKRFNPIPKYCTQFDFHEYLKLNI